MARGNQRDKAREKNQKEAAAQVDPATFHFALLPPTNCFSASFSGSTNRLIEEEEQRMPYS